MNLTFPWNRSTAAQAVEVTDLNERESRKAMREQFGQDDGFPDSQTDDSHWALLETEAEKHGWSDTLSPRAALRSEHQP